ncbi:hypothetical protein IEE86_01585 [Bacillus sp. 28A-2]|nr:hypothetical protein [Bacillus sp. 28A-2]
MKSYDTFPEPIGGYTAGRAEANGMLWTCEILLQTIRRLFLIITYSRKRHV